MTEFPLPVRMVGPGSQPEEADELEYMPMPREMNTFRMPQVPERADAKALRAARDLLQSFLEDLSALGSDRHCAGADARPRRRDARGSDDPESDAGRRRGQHRDRRR